MSTELRAYLDSLHPPEPQQPDLDVAVQEDPDRFAQARDVGKDMDLPPALINDGDIKAADTRRYLNTLDPNSFGPALRETLVDPERAAVAWDDIPNLQETEGLLRRGSVAWQIDRAAGNLKDIGSAAYSGLFQLSSGLLGTLESAVDLVPGDFMEPVSQFLSKRRQEGQALSQYYTPQSEIQAVNDIYSGLASGTANILALGTSVATANPAWALGVMGGMSYGLSASEAKDQGLTAAGAAIHGMSNALIEIGTERMPAVQLIKDLGLDTPLIKILANQLVAEIPGEQVATVLQDFTDWAFLPENAERTFQEYIEERPSAALSTLIATVVGTSMQTGVLYGADRMLRQDDAPPDEMDVELARMALSQASQIDLDRAIVLAQDSKLSGRAADVYRDFLTGVGSDMTVFVPPEILEQAYGGGDQFIPPELAEQIDGSGADVAIPMDQFMAGIARDELAMETLRPHLKLGPDLMSAQDLEQGADMGVRRLLERAAAEADIKAQADAVWEDVRDQLVATGRMTEDVANTSAMVIPAYATVAAAERGLSVEEVYERMGLTVTREEELPVQGEVIAQAAQEGYEGQDRGEAQEWLAAVRKGLDMSQEARMQRAAEQGFDIDQVWYHGTGDVEIESFDARKIGSRYGLDRQGYFFTNDPSDALGGASDYAGKDGSVYPVYLRMDNPYTLEQYADDIGASVEDVMLYENEPQHLISIFDDDTDFIIQKANERGADGLLFTYTHTDGVVDKLAATFDNRAIRSVNAAFDPDQADSPNLLAQPAFDPDQVVEEKVQVEETGETVTIREPMQRRYDQTVKRRDVVQQLLECVS